MQDEPKKASSDSSYDYSFVRTEEQKHFIMEDIGNNEMYIIIFGRPPPIYTKNHQNNDEFLINLWID